MDLEFDRNHLWHPYTNLSEPVNVYPVARAEGVYLELEDGRKIIDAMSSWWACIHGYNHPELNQAVIEQVSQMSHVMFGGLTHNPAITLGKKLVEITADDLDCVFFADSGSVAVEAAMKMAAQYCHENGQLKKDKFLTFSKGYHGDTFGAMSVCDPETGMHHKFSRLLNQHLFVDSPVCAFGAQWQDKYIEAFAEKLAARHHEIIAVIFEPIVQGAGGMNFYSPEYLTAVKQLCEQYEVLLIFDEIATGFGRTGKLFAYEHADVVPDILCLGKALTGGYMTLSAVMCNRKVADGINSHFMHGPTFMANPLACQVALASINMLLKSPWKNKVLAIEKQLKSELQDCMNLPMVKEVRVLGAIGVIEMKESVDIEWFQSKMVEQGVWIRPFMNLIYIMPPFIIEPEQISHITKSILSTLKKRP
ncbi:adenosylmethionine--8-amino-7-oxononanoate transaminase [Marinicella litoralis]|uniref:Adenosylmethionine-8-amino-7-oxononanoate aminotransferase n=1 Tax=Marinicella litoralis TaxID=644220 RepID=A0A4R6XKU3_9GAMM|nr:adenosylmethionine--8-amino-7-oxononanoate transaminase [Marinicella litoralis]TDR18524.1 adenosylmethionine-8-amino-7-oxononanoate aminotransferase [Marinicella litoralis]